MIDSENNYIVTYEKIYDYKNYNIALIILFIILLSIYFCLISL